LLWITDNVFPYALADTNSGVSYGTAPRSQWFENLIWKRFCRHIHQNENEFNSNIPHFTYLHNIYNNIGILLTWAGMLALQFAVIKTATTASTITLAFMADLTCFDVSTRLYWVGAQMPTRQTWIHVHMKWFASRRLD
jgi:hypothetical protein